MQPLATIQRYYLLIICIIVLVSALYPISQFDVNEWDEARNGVNAYEMYHNRDYLNLHYAGQIDSWNAKPPLLTWCIVLCYKLFGFNEFSLRLPSLLFSIGFFIYYYKLVKRMANEHVAFAGCLLLLSCKAILGHHVGISGDFDALLLLFLTASAYHFFRYTLYQRKLDILLTGFFTGLAFYAKGPAAFLYLPGFAIYLTYTRKWHTVLKNKYGWLAIFTAVKVAVTWVCLQAAFGNKTAPAHTMHGSKNSLEVLLWHDIAGRFFTSDFEHNGTEHNYLFIINSLDIYLNVWNYLFYLVIITGCILLYRHRSTIKTFLQQEKIKGILFSIGMMAPVCIFLSLSMNQHGWYLAPIWGFVAYITVTGIQCLAKRWKPVIYIAALLCIALLARHAYYLYTLPDGINQTFARNKNAFEDSDKVVYLGTPYQHIYLYTVWQGKPMVRINEIQEAAAYSGQLLLINKREMEKAGTEFLTPVFNIAEDFTIAKIR